MALSDKLPPHINEETIQESVVRRVEEMDRAGVVQGLAASMERLGALPPCPTPKSLSEVDSVARGMFESVAPHTVCRKGCSACCHMAVMITSREAKVIGVAYNVRPVLTRPVIDHSNVKRYMGSPCPFLEGGSCSIYEHRPLACRGFFNLSDFPEICDVVNYPGCDVPALDLTPVWHRVSFEAFGNGDYPADIRDFFPEGLHPTQSL